MKILVPVISLGEYCITSTALRRLNLQSESMPFDWSAGILQDKCGLGGLEGKVNLICNDFENFFNLEDLENRGNNQENDIHNLWVVNKRTGLQYKHDFSANSSIAEQYPEIKDKYMRRIKRLYDYIAKNNKILFVFMARSSGFDNELLIEQQKKLASKFPDKKVKFLYILHDPQLKSKKKYREINLTPDVHCIYCNFIFPTSCEYPESWNGNTELYYPLLKTYYDTFYNKYSISSIINIIMRPIRKLKSLF